MGVASSSRSTVIGGLEGSGSTGSELTPSQNMVWKAVDELTIHTAPSPVEVFILSKTTSSVTVGWGQASGEVKGFILSITNQTSNQQLNLSAQETWSYRFEGLSPGSHYTVDVISSNGERTTNASVDINTIPGAPQEVLLVEEDVTSSVFVSWGAAAGGWRGTR
ncbi:receptor-type tyrosine-protein phosphatase beta-like [Salmo trutta]|uniref:receptor-type tyrosine-protein phosphatase beta-like n=1 Tax=Salmo trutta TaxID=8032 RepID=UPI001130F786|nr:receptor-type tyrosine-protein phosphatase beta-like [Salmo trutta]